MLFSGAGEGLVVLQDRLNRLYEALRILGVGSAGEGRHAGREEFVRSGLVDFVHLKTRRSSKDNPAR
jgi:hypothetical protein